MNSFFLWATLGLMAFVPAIDGSKTVICPKCECCGCCETGTCKCGQCTCLCCVDECPTAVAKPEQEGCCRSRCCSK